MDQGESSNNYTQTFSLFPMESSQLQVSDEAFNLFHSIDRELCTRLIHNLGRDPAQSVQIMAFWMWLERESKDMHFVKRLLTLPFTLLNEVVDETLLCLRCVDSDDGYLIAATETLSLLPELLSNRYSSAVSLRIFHDSRGAVARAVSKIINTVCARAFSDILRDAWRAAPAPAAVDDSPPPPQTAVLFRGPPMSLPFVQTAPGLLGVPPPPPMGVLPPMPPQEVVGLPVHHMGYPAFDFDFGHMIGNDLGDMLGRSLSINNNRSDEINGVDETEVPADDRTIFLTFSKGYPISEEEVTEFFTRRFGDFIEALFMQEVGTDEQVLYARMVAYHESVIDGIVQGNKAKYVINGKHVWARKYVKKQHQTKWLSPPRGGGGGGGDESGPSGSSSSTTTGPAAEQS